ncbi:MAG: amino acid permease [Candidatus Omnitrophota bacterium]|nr:amino acid permease [Candidatus Omnitrophota bacterium]
MGGVVTLRRSLHLPDATALVIGCVIGAGIFRTAASISKHLQEPWLVMAVWVAGGFISFCGALCYAELGAAYPKTGGDYVYIKKAYGPAAGFLFGWTKIFTERVGTIAVLGFVFAEYLSGVLGLSPVQTRELAMLGILGLTWANIAGIHVGKGVQNLLTAVKLIALLAIIVVGLSVAPAAAAASLPAVSSLDLSTLQAFGVALVFVLWTYGGWTESAYVAEEIHDPHRNLPWSILLGLSVVTLLYLAVNWVYMRVIPLSEMPGTPLVAAEVMRRALGPAGATVTSLMIASSAFGALNGYILTSGRILMAVGQDHPLFSRLAALHPVFATPARALAFNAAIAVLLVWVGTFDQIVTYSTVVISVFFALAALAVIVLRVKDPATPRPYRVWGYPVTPVLFVLALGLFVANITWTQPKEAVFGFLLAAAGLPVYFLSKRK